MGGGEQLINDHSSVHTHKEMSFGRFFSISLPMCVIHSYVLRDSLVYTKAKIFGTFSPDSEGKQSFPLFSSYFLFVPLVWVVGTVFPCSRSLLFNECALNASAKLECEGVGPGCIKWAGQWEVPTLHPEFRSIFLVICSTNSPHCLKLPKI